MEGAENKTEKQDPTVSTTPTQSVASREQRKRENKTLYVKNLGASTTDADLENLFSEIGPTKHSFVIKDDENKQLCSGYGFVSFAFAHDAAKALKKLQGKQIGGKNRILIEWAKPRAPRAYIPKSKRVEEEEGEGGENEESSDSEDMQPILSNKSEKKRPNLKITDPSRVVVLTGKQVTQITDKELRDFFKSKKSQTNLSKITRTEEKVYITLGKTEESKKAKALLHGQTFKLKAKEEGGADIFTTLDAQVLSEGKRNRLIIRNLSFRCPENHLRNMFSKCGEVVQVSIPKDGTKKGGFAFIEFSSHEEAQAAIEKLNGEKIDKREIAVDWALPKDKYIKHIITSSSLPSDENQNIGDIIPQKNEKKSKSEDEEEDEEDEDEEMDDSDDESSSDAEGEKAAKKKKKGSEAESESESESEEEEEEESEDENFSADVHKGETIFIRNLSFDSTEEVIEDLFKKWGEISYVNIARDFQSNRSRGVAFVKFKSKQSVDNCLKEGYTTVPADAKEGESNIELDGRRLILSIAVDRRKATELAQTKTKTKKAKDKRNLYLAYEGVITSQDAAAETMSKSDLQKRHRALVEKKSKLQNPNYFVSKTRLSIRNIPREYTEADLKGLLKKYAKKGKLKQGKLVVDNEKIDPATGKPRSKGFGFVEFEVHEDALDALRALNNNPTIWSKGSRPIVEFAVENAKAILIHEAKLKKREAFRKNVTDDRQAGGSVPAVSDKLNDKKNKRKERREQKKKERKENKALDKQNKKEETGNQVKLTDKKEDTPNKKADQTNKKADQTNKKADQTNKKADQGIKKADQTNKKVDEGNKKADQGIKKADQTNKKADQTNKKVVDQGNKKVEQGGKKGDKKEEGKQVLTGDKRKREENIKNKQPPTKKSKVEGNRGLDTGNSNKAFIQPSAGGRAGKAQRREEAETEMKKPIVKKKKKEVRDSFDDVVLNYKRKFSQVAADTTKGSKKWFE